MIEPLLKVQNLSRHFGSASTPVRAVDDVSFEIAKGETLGLVGESGCGKTSLVRTLLKLGPATSGSALLDGVDITTASGRRLHELRRKMQVVFQDPYQSLNPRMRVDRLISEPWALHPGVVPKGRWREETVKLLESVGLRAEHADRYPSEFSGGQRQRLGIARALALNPTLLVCDEPVSALDVSVQAQVINLLAGLRRERNLAMLFVAHDLAVVRHVSDRVMVMYLGKIIETGPKQSIFSAAAHPYTQALMSAVPTPDPRRRAQRKRIVLQGDLPSPANPPSGCRFRTRCWKATSICAEQEPTLTARTAAPGLLTACHHADPEITTEIPRLERT
ncbi:ABC transporter ATP-binding protein [Rhizobium leguminosarum]|uniref:ABC transporter ATP-binding protein n=1 Tax=Rhizobium leguminosarum TaxID=384 RepID=UPI00143F5F61|nr:oligopeptide/dipeptide ABC transporter ATP-binding protein [Rhizobium leguminosarum]NKK62929.1 ATP-binding cassette domain-containing protein [Rhizobium leguminosarum bv. viciae]NKL03636.1 ATP-binding cassette domain-containing protein [Rhizobium leguminosarum bv. viciae]NKL83155.1 ATP-binding cassette domain-containing protein [Rhizobium leguminosarum bv. viciae]NKL88800.1 ATP-binding cassette domain-containing protein [Rhizobium leguminosarum bv. viciae]NKM90082.1 ATP-binding cassette dom